MIAWTGLLMHKKGIETKISESQGNQRFRADQQEVTWI